MMLPGAAAAREEPAHCPCRTGREFGAVRRAESIFDAGALALTMFICAAAILRLLIGTGRLSFSPARSPRL
jgi:hypothetical protein